MAKIHTHYDNLKVARLAPQEVIRAAYKALSQKYHPDKNPGDEKAARIMAILNSAYGTLSDPLRRKEHDEWIAAEEWEIEWLESTRTEDGRERSREAPAQSWEPTPVEAARPYSALRDPSWWFGLTLFFALGCASGVLWMGQTPVVPVALAAPVARADTDTRRDLWAGPKSGAPGAAQRGVPFKALAVTQLVIPERKGDCESELHSLIAPNDEPWPAQSGYLKGFPIGNKGTETKINIDNTQNGSPVMVKVYDLDRGSNVRHAYVLPRESLLIDELAAGKYEVRYQNVEAGGNKGECL